jgi:hypothetical protein
LEELAKQKKSANNILKKKLTQAASLSEENQNSFQRFTQNSDALSSPTCDISSLSLDMRKARGIRSSPF